jgi:hypothetical protein
MEFTALAGRRSAMLKAVFLSLVLIMALTMTLAFSPVARSAEPAGQEPVLESADYDIKDGTGPAIAGGVAYLFAGDDPYIPPLTNSKIVALDASNGDLMWQKELEWAGGMGSKARPLVEGNLLYIGCGKSVYCLDTTNNGNILWSTDITPSPNPLGDSIIINDPVMYSDGGGNQVIVVGDYWYGYFVGLDAYTGSEIWRYALDANSSVSGAPGVDDTGNRLYLPQSAAFGFSPNGKVHCIDVSGAPPAKKWEYAATYDLAGLIAYNQGYIYFSDFAYGGPISAFYCLSDDGGQASLRWSQPMWGSSGLPLIDTNSGTVYVCGNDYSVGGNHFYAFDMESGELAWDNPNWGSYNGNCALSPATGYLYAGSFDTAGWAHNLGIASLDPYTGGELFYVEDKGGGDPVVSGGLVYTTADGRLYAYAEYMPGSYDWYFAEGCTGAGVEEWLTLTNPNADSSDDARVTVTYLFNGDRDPLTRDYPVPAGARSTINVGDEVGPGYEVSMKVTSDQPIVAERPMYFSYMSMAGQDWTGGHCVLGADEPQGEWYFAEGYTGAGFEEWLCLANFGDQSATVTVDYLYTEGAPLQEEYQIAGNSRKTLSVNDRAGYDRDVSMKIDSDQPIVAERPIYFSYKSMAGQDWTGGHCVIGSEERSKKWYFAEGYTGAGFEEWLCLANPNGADATVDVTYLYQAEDALTETYVLQPNSRQTLNVNLEAGSGKDLGMTVESDLPILAERPQYFNYQGKWDGGHCVLGAGIPSNYWILAEGYTRSDCDEYICISNPGKEAADVVVRPLFDGSDGEESDYEVAPGQRFTLSLKSAGPVERAYAITSNRGIVVERSMYFDYMGTGGYGWPGGHCCLGATLDDIY